MRWKMLGVMAAGRLVIVGPWVVRNLTTFEKPTVLGTGFGWVLLYGNCDATYYGDQARLLGRPLLAEGLPAGARGDASSTSAPQQGHRLHRGPQGASPGRRAARVGRMFERLPSVPERGVQRVLRAARRRHVVGHPRRATTCCCRSRSAASSCCGAAGSRSSRSSRSSPRPRSRWRSSFAITRYRAPVDVIMPLLAAVAIDAAIRWFGHRRDTADAPVPEPDPRHRRPSRPARGRAMTLDDRARRRRPRRRASPTSRRRGPATSAPGWR